MREATVVRKTKETEITLTVQLDGSGKTDISTGIGFFDHMLTALAVHGGMDLTLKVEGDLQVDCHHTVEDTGIVLGQAIKKALGDKVGITRFADCHLPMDEALAFAAIDVSGRGYLVFDAEFRRQYCGDYETAMTEEFFWAVCRNAELTLHLKKVYGVNDHHATEALFKAAARVFRLAFAVTGRSLPTTKGAL